MRNARLDEFQAGIKILLCQQSLYSQGYGLPSGHERPWKLDHKEVRTPKNWCLWTVVLEKTLEVPWTTRRSSQSILREISPEYSLEGLMLKLKLPYFGYLMQTANSLEKTLMLDKIEGKRKRGWQDEMLGSHHQLNGHEFEQTLGNGEEQGSLACCSPWGFKESDMTERLNWTEHIT